MTTSGRPPASAGRTAVDPRRIPRVRRDDVLPDPDAQSQGPRGGVTLARRYLVGVSMIAAGGAILVIAVPREVRAEVLWGVGTGLVLQVPLGWLALRSLGTEHFMLSWGLGTLVRFTSVAIAGLVIVPALGGAAGPMLGSMVGVLVALLLVEGVTAVREHSREDER